VPVLGLLAGGLAVELLPLDPLEGVVVAVLALEVLSLDVLLLDAAWETR
jgi:hypothetical protein